MFFYTRKSISNWWWDVRSVYIVYYLYILKVQESNLNLYILWKNLFFMPIVKITVSKKIVSKLGFKYYIGLLLSYLQ